MASTLKTVPRHSEAELETPLVGHGLPLQEEVAAEAEVSAGSLEEAIEMAANRSLLMLERDTIEQKRERVERMFDRVAALVAQLSPELCKEDHGRYMALTAQVEQLCLCIETRLVSLEHDVNAQDIPDVPFVVWFFRFADRARKIIHARAVRVRQRDADLAIIRSWRELVRTERRRPVDIHEAAVQHKKRLILHERQDYGEMEAEIRDLARKAAAEKNRDHYSKTATQMYEAVEQLKAMRSRTEQEAYDRALQQVQESDNGPRQK